MCQLLICAVILLIELCKHQIPKFHKAVAFAANLTVRRAAAVFRPAVKIQLGAGAARACADFPEIVFFPHTDDAIRRNADMLRPNIKRLVVVLIDRDPQLVHRHFHHFRGKLPRPLRRVVFEIIAKGEIAQHFKKRAVTRSFSHTLNIRCADALLASRHPLGRRLLPSGKIRLERRHSRVDQKKAGIVLRHERKARQPVMPLAFKKR